MEHVQCCVDNIDLQVMLVYYHSAPKLSTIKQSQCHLRCTKKKRAATHMGIQQQEDILSQQKAVLSQQKVISVQQES